MKIISKLYEPRYPSRLHNAKPGDCVEFERRFNSRNEHDAKFLVLHVPTEYIVEKKRTKDGEYRIMVSNLHTGLTSLVNAERRVRGVDAHVIVNE